MAELSFAEQIAMASKGLKKVERKATIKEVLEKEEKRITESQISKLSFAEQIAITSKMLKKPGEKKDAPGVTFKTEDVKAKP